MSIRVNGKVIASNGDVKTETDNLVTTDTNQTITATKVFTAEQQKKSTVIDITTQPENYTSNNAFRFLDKNDQISGYIENGQMASGEITTGIHAKNKDGYQPHVSIFAPLSGTTGAYAIAPRTPEDAPDNAITTIDYVKNNYVDKTSNQTISGVKTFTASRPVEIIADTNQQIVPTTDTSCVLGLYRNATYTKGDGFSSWIQGVRASNGLSTSGMYVRRFLESDSQPIVNYISVQITADGSPFAVTKTPPAYCVNEEIVTAAWFKQSNCSVRTVIETYHNGTEWYRVWSDGWKEQGGVVLTGNSATPVTVTLLTPFSDANYTLQATCNPLTVQWAQMVDLQIVNKTATSFGIIANPSNNNNNWFACGY